MNLHLKHRFIAGAITLWTAVGAMPASSSAQDSQAYLGTLFTTLGHWCPVGSVQAEGQLYSINNFVDLYSIIGTTYGGDGRTTFAIPDMRGRTQVGAGQGDGLTPKILGQKGGSEQVSMTIAQMPPHTHSGEVTTTVDMEVVTSTDGSTHAIPQEEDMLATRQQGFIIYKPYTRGTPPIDVTSLNSLNIPKGSNQGDVVVGETGGYPDADGNKADPIKLRPSSLVVRYCFVIKGPYPSRPQ